MSAKGPSSTDAQAPAGGGNLGDTPVRHPDFDDAIGHGGRLAVGDKHLADGPLFLSPAVLDEVPSEIRILNEERFGPAMAIGLVQTTPSR